MGAEPSDCDTKAEDELSTEFEDIARITALDLSHELSVLGLIAANIGIIHIIIIGKPIRIERMARKHILCSIQ